MRCFCVLCRYIRKHLIVTINLAKCSPVFLKSHRNISINLLKKAEVTSSNLLFWKLTEKSCFEQNWAKDNFLNSTVLPAINLPGKFVILQTVLDSYFFCYLYLQVITISYKIETENNERIHSEQVTLISNPILSLTGHIFCYVSLFACCFSVKEISFHFTEIKTWIDLPYLLL